MIQTTVSYWKYNRIITKTFSFRKELLLCINIIITFKILLFLVLIAFLILFGVGENINTDVKNIFVAHFSTFIFIFNEHNHEIGFCYVKMIQATVSYWKYNKIITKTFSPTKELLLCINIIISFKDFTISCPHCFSHSFWR